MFDGARDTFLGSVASWNLAGSIQQKLSLIFACHVSTLLSHVPESGELKHLGGAQKGNMSCGNEVAGRFRRFHGPELLNVHVYKSLLPVHRSQSILCSAVRSRRCDMESSGPHTPDRICHGSSKARICSCRTQGMLLTLLHVFTFIAHLSWSPCACAVS